VLFVCALFKLVGIFMTSWQKTTVVGTGEGGEKKGQNGRSKKGARSGISKVERGDTDKVNPSQ